MSRAALNREVFGDPRWNTARPIASAVSSAVLPPPFSAKRTVVSSSIGSVNFVEAAVVLGADLSEAESAHVALLGGPSGDS